MSTVVENSTAGASASKGGDVLLRAMVATEYAAHSLAERAGSLRQRMGESKVVWFFVFLAVAVVVVGALIALCIAKGYSGVGGFYKAEDHWYGADWAFYCK